MSKRDHAPSERHPEELHRDGRPLQPEASGRLHALQRSAGNQALSARLARAPDAGKPDVKQEERDKAETTGARATLPGIGTIQLLSASFGWERGAGGTAGGGAGRERENRVGIRDISFASHVGDHSPLLSKAVVDGKAMDAEVIFQRSKSIWRLKLAGAVVTNYTSPGSGGGTVESWALNFQSLEQSTEGG